MRPAVTTSANVADSLLTEAMPLAIIVLIVSSNVRGNLEEQLVKK
jgi:hypothetical protein